MGLQELIESNEVDFNANQARAFFLGAQTGDKPMTFPKAMDELLSEAPEAKKELEKELKNLWDELSQNTKASLENLFTGPTDLDLFLTEALKKLDYFLTGFSLAGAVNDEEAEEVSEELENLVMDLDDYLSGEKAKADAEEIKDQLLGAWEAFVELKSH
jgi:hypothetical protein